MQSLQSLLIGIIDNVPDIKIKGITSDSRNVKDGDVFVCIKGSKEDGHNHTLEAEMLGAVAIVAERKIESNLPTIIVENSREVYSKMCERYFDNPEKQLKIVSIVGTNGKTTTSYIIEHILKNVGYKTGVIGTLGYKILDEKHDLDMTTPDSFTMYKILRRMVKAGVEIVILEMSAHAISQNRCAFSADVGIFTNISRDHLDYFHDYESYYNTKVGYFLSGKVKSAIVNTDDKGGREIYKKANFPVISYGIDEPSDVFAINIEGGSSTKFVINLFDELYEMETPLIGKHNVYNTLAGVTLCKLLKVPTPIIAEKLKKIPNIPGRFNVFKWNGGNIIVDFAHTPDGLENLIRAGRSITKNKLYTIFGCGGNRDIGKRAEMGEIASTLSDAVIITEDNSRDEEISKIISDIMSGVKNKENTIIIENRKEAILCGVGLIKDGDTLIIAGKGNEKYIEKKGRKIKFSDIDEVISLTRG